MAITNGSGRYVGIQHRVKKTSEGEARPTIVSIMDGGESMTLKLEDETAELDFVLGRYPVKWRKAQEGEDLSAVLPHHRRHEKKDDPKSPVREVPERYEGLRNGDIVGMSLGGSGDRLAYAISSHGEKNGMKLLRIPPFALKAQREGEKEDDAALLAHLVLEQPKLFYPAGPRDRELIMIRERFAAFRDAMKARIACEQRLRQQMIGKIFCAPDGLYPQGSVEDEFAKAKTNDDILLSLQKEEKRRERELASALDDFDAYVKILSKVTGCGTRIGARLIVAIGDIRRFETKAKLKAFCGAHVLPDGHFPRRRSGEVANWHSDARQALYLLMEQWNRRPNSEWGVKLRQYKVKLRAKHPEPEVMENGKKRYTDGHIHKMAMWRTATKFVEWLYREWRKLERERTERTTLPVTAAPVAATA